MAFSATWFLLEQEGLLARACLCNGLTALRRANLGDKKGWFYSAFLNYRSHHERMRHAQRENFFSLPGRTSVM
jgi:hypothetical protein